MTKRRMIFEPSGAKAPTVTKEELLDQFSSQMLTDEDRDEYLHPEAHAELRSCADNFGRP